MTDDNIGTAADDLRIGALMSYAAAESRKAEILGSAELRQKIMDGEAATSAEWRRITEALSRPPETPVGQREELVEHINASAGYGLSPGVLEQVRENKAISPEERRMTLALWEDRKADREWIARLNRGELKARQEMALININLASPVKDA